MSEPFRMLPKEVIRAWLRGLVRPLTGSIRAMRRNGPTIYAVARYMGLSVDSLKCTAYREKGDFSLDRQRHFSKVIALIENGQLEFEQAGRFQRGVLRAHPKPRVRYCVQMTSAGPKLATVERPPPYRGLYLP